MAIGHAFIDMIKKYKENDEESKVLNLFVQTINKQKDKNVTLTPNDYMMFGISLEIIHRIEQDSNEVQDLLKVVQKSLKKEG